MSAQRQSTVDLSAGRANRGNHMHTTRFFEPLNIPRPPIVPDCFLIFPNAIRVEPPFSESKARTTPQPDSRRFDPMPLDTDTALSPPAFAARLHRPPSRSSKGGNVDQHTAEHPLGRDSRPPQGCRPAWQMRPRAVAGPGQSPDPTIDPFGARSSRIQTTRYALQHTGLQIAAKKQALQAQLRKRAHL